MTKYEQYLQEQKQLEEGIFKSDKVKKRIVGNTAEEANNALDKFMADNKGYSPAIIGKVGKPQRDENGKFYYDVSINKNSNEDDKSLAGRLKRGLGFGDKEYSNRGSQNQELQNKKTEEPKSDKSIASTKSDVKTDLKEPEKTQKAKPHPGKVIQNSKEELEQRKQLLTKRYGKHIHFNNDVKKDDIGRWMETFTIDAKDDKGKDIKIVQDKDLAAGGNTSLDTKDTKTAPANVKLTKGQQILSVFKTLKSDQKRKLIDKLSSLIKSKPQAEVKTEAIYDDIINVLVESIEE